MKLHLITTIIGLSLISMLSSQVFGQDCECKGGMKAITLSYDGASGQTVSVFNKDELIETFENATTGMRIEIDAASIGEDKLEKNVSVVVGETEVDLHTSCSVDILGQHGDITVLGYVDKEGNVCSTLPPDTSNPTPPPCGECDGGVTTLVLEYTGEGTRITVGDEAGNVYWDGPASNGTISIAGKDDGKFEKNNVLFFVDGAPNATIHMSCSKPVGPGLVYGDFTILSGTSRNGGELCEEEPNCECDGGITTLMLQYQGESVALVTVSDSEDNVYFSNAAVPPGALFSIFGNKDDGKFEKNDVNFYVDGQLAGTVHMSCSKPVYPGMDVGSLMILSGESRDGGALCDPIIIDDTSIIIIPNDPPEDPCGECDGGVTTLVLEYTGEGTRITVGDEAGNVYWDGPASNGTISIAGKDDGKFEKNNVLFFVDGAPNATIHMSCSKPVGPGLVYGDFTILSGTSRNGGELCEEEPNCECDGGITTLMLQYQGESVALVTVSDSEDNVYFSNAAVPPGALFSIFGNKDDGKFEKNDVNFYVDGQLAGTVHMSCSKPVYPGMDVGSLMILSGESRDGGALCDPIIIDDTSIIIIPNDPPEDPCGECDGGVTTLVLEYTGEGTRITVGDEAGNVYWDGPASNGTISIAGKDDGKFEKNNVLFFVDGAPNATIHMSCSKPVGPGLVYGDFTILSGTSRNGGELCEEEPNCECDGGITTLMLQYQGESVALVTVSDSEDNVYFSNAAVPPGALFSIFGNKDDGKFEKNDVNFYVDGQLAGTVHMSCSKPVYPGMDVGSLMILSGESRDGGALCDPIIIDDTSIIIIPNDPPEDPCGECDGGVTTLVLEYTGEGTRITVGDEAGNVYWDGPASNGTISIAGKDDGKFEKNNVLFFVDGAPNATIHMSCSKPVGPGLVYGDFTILSGTSRNGGELCEEEPNCECDGGITTLMLQYQGESVALVTVSDSEDNVYFSNAAVPPGALFSIFGNKDDGKFEKNDVNFYVDGQLAGTVHMSCSKPVYPGMDVGSLMILSGESRDGGALCDPIIIDDTSIIIIPNDPPEDPCGECDGGVTTLVLEYTGEGTRITVGDEAGNVYWDGPASNGTISIAGKDDGKFEKNNVLFFVDGAPNATIHMSCSKPVGPGLVYGDFTILSGTSRNGGELCEEEPNCECDGGITTLMLQYQGESVALVTVSDSEDNVYFSNAAVPPGALFSIFGNKDDGKFEKNDVNFYVDGQLAGTVHMSCSKPVYPGMDVGSLMILSGESRDGGALCDPIIIDDTSIIIIPNDPPEDPCGECDGGVTTLVLEYTGEGTRITVGDEAGNVYWDGPASNGTISIAGKDDGKFEKNNVLFFVDGAPNATIHMSCSKPVGVGLSYGDFSIVSGTSRDGGELCPAEAIPSPPQDEACEILELDGAGPYELVVGECESILLIGVGEAPRVVDVTDPDEPFLRTGELLTAVPAGGPIALYLSAPQGSILRIY